MVGEKIRRIRTLKGFSQDYMADKLKISQPAYSDLENNKTNISLTILDQIAKVFELTANEIINFDEKKVFNSTFNENSKGFFNVKKVVIESFENERQSYKDQIKSLKEIINYLRKKLDGIE